MASSEIDEGCRRRSEWLYEVAKSSLNKKVKGVGNEVSGCTVEVGESPADILKTVKQKRFNEGRCGEEI